jgi:hypothetical protein
LVGVLVGVGGKGVLVGVGGSGVLVGVGGTVVLVGVLLGVGVGVGVGVVDVNGTDIADSKTSIPTCSVVCRLSVSRIWSSSMARPMSEVDSGAEP